ncbi:MAG TPA: CheR family methyltransferase [Anaeromyxobacteraceae bacterium]|nr:CheR family methyltransferase [Anaeromyxobacteraceae bacterium]
MTEPSAAHLAEMAAVLRERTGLAIRPDGYLALRLALRARMAELGREVADWDAYLALFRRPAGDDELRRLLPLVTVGKTSFFRDERQFRALEAILPGMLAEARHRGSPVSLWSAGCATGEEVYSIAMTAAGAGAAPGELSVLGTDVNPEAVAAATRGSFDVRRLKEVPEALLARWFVPRGEACEVAPELRRFVGRLSTHNLVGSSWPDVPGGGWDAIFCRNVIIYFDTPTTQRLLARFLESLAPGGWLFLGYSESLFRLFAGFELAEVAGAFVYRKPARPAAGSRGPPLPVVHLHPQPPRAEAPAPATPDPPAPQEVQDEVAALIAEGRFATARHRLEEALARDEDLGLRLTLANLHGVLRDPGRARASYLAALAAEPLSAEAHLFFGVHLVSEGDLDAGARELSRALFIDPDLALAHYYLGRCREAQRDAFRARLCYKNAVDAWRRVPEGRRQAFLGHYPDLPDDGASWARAAESALAAL